MLFRSRAGTKQAMRIALLQNYGGTTIAEITAATGWMAHTARGAISGVLKKKLGLVVTAERIAGCGTVYWIDGPST